MRFRTANCLLIAALLVAPAAYAQEAGTAPPPAAAAPAGPPYIPILLSQADVTAITNYLGGIPYNQAAPIINFLAAKEAELQRGPQPPTPPAQPKK